MTLQSETEESTSPCQLADPTTIKRLVDAIPVSTLSGWETDLIERAAWQAESLGNWEIDNLHFTRTERERLSALARIYLGETLEWYL